MRHMNAINISCFAILHVAGCLGRLALGKDRYALDCVPHNGEKLTAHTLWRTNAKRMRLQLEMYAQCERFAGESRGRTARKSRWFGRKLASTSPELTKLVLRASFSVSRLLLALFYFLRSSSLRHEEPYVAPTISYLFGELVPFGQRFVGLTS
jgi:hypothetical protein